MTLLHIKSFSCHVTLLLKGKLQCVGHKWVICGSHLDCSVGQWVEWVNRCDPLSTQLVFLDIGGHIFLVNPYNYVSTIVLNDIYNMVLATCNVTLASKF